MESLFGRNITELQKAGQPLARRIRAAGLFFARIGRGRQPRRIRACGDTDTIETTPQLIRNRIILKSLQLLLPKSSRTINRFLFSLTICNVPRSLGLPFDNPTSQGCRLFPAFLE
ncbi:hypothetical protein Sfum_2159 [Syntrophobacter fumaroxidans MPOB]|uniref:Uncharacterized protein n=1 Tax=Syntrophobacter fumaroxidans (strain DSM 10017 / MPOB) TaxID=335543 RepID=A0LK89_SYNFM|nr:hypothetical protein Sfum_2159 [Syntrophobacter fumaroxidans MPOB]